jgi:lysyl-tRNA synthetase, class I
MAEKFFWADEMADKLIKENKGDVFVCASGITPSGNIHIGNFREVITTDLVVKALEKKGKKAKFIYSWDDFDRFRKVPGNLPKDKLKEYEDYIGMSVSEVPSPFSEGSYAEYFEKEFENALKKIMIKPKFIRQSVMNKKCAYADLTKIALDKRKTIIEILDKYRKEPLAEDWYPIAIYCETCKKDFTKILGVEDYEIEYECKCGFKNKIDYRKVGIVGVKWRVDWPMRWFYEKVGFEPGGIDHSVQGGSFTTAKEIVKDVFGYVAPRYVMYEWVKIKGGSVFSSSSGNALTLDDVGEIYESEVLRYLFVGTRPNKSFQISFDNDVIKIYEDFDRLEEKYFAKKADAQEKRIYELSVVDVPSKKPERESFRHLTTLVQIGEVGDLNKESKIRSEKVRNWLDKYAGEDMKFEIKSRLGKLGKVEKEIGLEILKIVEKDLKEDEILDEVKKIPEKLNIDVKEFFEKSYNLLIGKSKGPKLVTLIYNGNDEIKKLLGDLK